MDYEQSNTLPSGGLRIVFTKRSGNSGTSIPSELIRRVETVTNSSGQVVKHEVYDKKQEDK